MDRKRGVYTTLLGAFGDAHQTLTKPHKAAMHLYRFTRRLIATRHAKSKSFRHRCRTIWNTCWAERIGCGLLTYLIGHENPNKAHRTG
jgi:hypothetical protein